MIETKKNEWNEINVGPGLSLGECEIAGPVSSKDSLRSESGGDHAVWLI